MNATQVQTGYEPVHQEEVTSRTMSGGAVMESIGALATLALAIAGLAGGFSITLAAIATIVFGASLWIEGGAFIARHQAEFSRADARLHQWSQGLSSEFLGGLSGIVFGILALLGVVPMTLLSIAVLVFGATMLISGSTWFVSSAQSMFGLAGLTLGLLAVCGLSPITLVLVALLCFGAAALFDGAANSAKLALASQK